MKNKLQAEHGDIIVFEDGVRARVVKNLDYEERLDLKEIDSNEIMTSHFLTDDLQLGKNAWHRDANQSKIIKIINGGWLNKSYAIDELEEGVEYKMVGDKFKYSTYIIKNSILKNNYNLSGYRASNLSYNTIKGAKFTIVKPIIKYTFDEAKKDCEENGAEYEYRQYNSDGKRLASIQIMSRNKDGVVTIRNYVIDLAESFFGEKDVILADFWIKKEV